MKGFELRLWRIGMDWTQERAAEELGVTLRGYQNWEKPRREVSRAVELATGMLSVHKVWPEMTRTINSISLIAGH